MHAKNVEMMFDVHHAIFKNVNVSYAAITFIFLFYLNTIGKRDIVYNIIIMKILLLYIIEHKFNSI